MMNKKALTLIETYSKSIVDVAFEHNLVDIFKEEISSLLKIFAETPLGDTLASEDLGHSEKAELVDTLKMGSHPFLQNFLEVIKYNEREALLEDILRWSREVLSNRCNEYRLDIEVASPLSDQQKERLKATAETKFAIAIGEVNEVLKPEVIGGFILKANNKVIDTSIKSQLQQLKMNLK
ncbi:F0F1 ATP synthase subunit delta [Streptococcus hyovaginalis]|uniref:F0F1 ATP synthase subunit delta n=1 Tax=Streptococcus hyovaginalis TaxID=149015 RepID=UPI002A910C49|nr:F0F1 ATP synthase subunit delta [Streptococcus hyovaginalis]MDY5973982.1 F0F1 ATP synthase subunit delta [Streptococcus hyovaginalis]